MGIVLSMIYTLYTIYILFINVNKPNYTFFMNSAREVK